MLAGALLALSAVLAAVANHGRLRWQGPGPVPWGDWSKRWWVAAVLAVLAMGAAVGARCGGAP